MISDFISNNIPPQMNFIEFGYLHSNALVTFFFQKDNENVVSRAYSQWLPAA